MAYDVKLIGAKLRRWENYLNNFRLPQWDDLPDMDLYMDQVVMLLQRYLNFLPEDEHGNAAITASIINNYVRLKIMPPPVKKKYTRVHMAYLIMVCSLKQSVNIPYIQKMPITTCAWPSSSWSVPPGTTCSTAPKLRAWTWSGSSTPPLSSPASPNS